MYNIILLEGFGCLVIITTEKRNGSEISVCNEDAISSGFTVGEIRDEKSASLLANPLSGCWLMRLLNPCFQISFNTALLFIPSSRLTLASQLKADYLCKGVI